MKIPNLPLAGSCRCGDVQIEISADPLITAACHCEGCQKMSASAFSLTAIIPAEGFAVTKGKTERGGLGEGEQIHHFCPRCMTWMFTQTDGFDGFYNVRPTLFKDVSWFTPFIETMTNNKLDWVSVPVRHSFEGFPSMDDFQSLMVEFAKAG